MNLTPRGRLYVGSVALAGLVVLAECIHSLIVDPNLWSEEAVGIQWLVLAGLTLLSGSFTVKVPGLMARLSVSETFVFASVLLFGPCAGTVTVGLDTLIASLRGKTARAPLRLLFNQSAPALCLWVAAQVFYAMYGGPPLSQRPPSHQPVPLPEIVWPLLVLTIVYFLGNSWLVALALAFERKAGAFGIWRRNFLWLSVNYFGGASVAGLLVSYTQRVDVTALGIIVPLLVISYLTFKTALDRIEDATRHVEEVSRLYLSTVETLATAIDAKDQVTHGHIRRVQKFALGLADAVGIKDERQLKAIEAAALLHDTGKLVVPEHILNKPGRLTVGEFEKMKRHASAGADILSWIRFPYPVVPIVRHHHENWDGTGYPDGLRGTTIPIGARILAVVDCFDALTSDRPYRRRLDDFEAMQILIQRRGIMYDPLIVDTFVGVKDKLAQSLSMPESSVEKLVHRDRPVAVEPSSDIPSSATQNAPVQKLANVLLASVVAATNARLAVLFLRDSRLDELHSIAARGRDGIVAFRTTMQIGSRVSGWVAANGSSVINADAALDIPDAAQSFGLSRCLCLPAIHNGEILGVLSLYLDDARGFSEKDQRMVEAAIAAIDLRPVHEFLSDFATRPLQTTTRTIH